jgi:hypothetical protein
MTKGDTMPAPGVPEANTWEWITAGGAALLAFLAGIGRWLGGGRKESDSKQLDRIEESLKLLCKALTTPNEDGYPVATSKKLAGGLKEQLDRIERKVDQKLTRRRGPEE